MILITKTYHKKLTLRHTVYSCLKNGDFKTLELIRMMHSAKDIELFYKKYSSSLLNLTLISFENPQSLEYLVDKLPQNITCQVLGADNFSILCGYIRVYETSKNNGLCDENRRKEFIQHLDMSDNRLWR